MDAYPVVERYGLIFAFLGDLPQAERPPILAIPEWGQEGWRTMTYRFAHAAPSAERMSLYVLAGDPGEGSDLADAQPDGTRPVIELLARESGPASRALETVVVTARLSGALATKLVQRALAKQAVSVVWIDTPSFASRPTRVEPELLRLQAAGVAVAVVRQGDSLATVLGAASALRSSHG